MLLKFPDLYLLIQMSGILKKMAEMAESDQIMMTCPNCKEEIVDPQTTNPSKFEFLCAFFCIIPFCYRKLIVPACPKCHKPILDHF